MKNGTRKSENAKQRGNVYDTYLMTSVQNTRRKP